MKSNLKKFVQVASLALTCVAGTVNAKAESNFAGRAAAFALPAINTGLLTGGLLGGVTINGQVTHPNVFVFPAENQQWFTTVRTCFNPLSVLAALNPLLPVLGGPVTVNYEVFDDTGTSVKTLNGIVVQPNACDMHTSDVTTDPLFTGLAPGVYSVIATAPLLQNLLALNLGVLYGSSNSTGRDVLKALNLDPKHKVK